MLKNKWWSIIIFCILISVNLNQAQAQKFEAFGPTYPLKKQPAGVGAVKVSFDMLPTTMSFDLPWHYCMVSENGIKFAYFAAETYDPRDWEGTGASASFEPGMDKEGRYARVWIEYASAARIVVRVRYALNNEEYDIAHSDIPSDSPYGEGDWGDEWYTIYPDGTFVRHMKIYTGLAAMSQPFGFNREPPQIVHEFMESIVIGAPGHVPTDDIDTACLTLYKMVDNNGGGFYQQGRGTTISYSPFPEDFGDFRDANIMLINSKSKYKAFTIGMPYGVRVKPYGLESRHKSIYPFQTWTGYSEPSIAYIAAIGHMLNYWHFRRTSTTLEQIYLHGMTNTANPQSELVNLGWSWILGPKLQVPGVKGDYFKYTYDQTQKAYIVPRKGLGPAELEFELEADPDFYGVAQTIVNPAFVVKDWGMAGIELKVDGKLIEPGKDFRIGYEETPSGTNLILWLKMSSTESKQFTLTPVLD
jgi:hypothetical protein